MYVVLAGEGVPPTLVWANNDGLYSSILEAVPDTVPATPAPSSSGSQGPASGSPFASPPAASAAP